MLSSVINSLRVFKGLYDLAFSEDQFYVEQRAESLGGVQHCVEQAREGWHNPPPARVYVRKPFKIVLGILILALFLAAIVGGRRFSRRVYVSVSGGVVDEVIVPPETNGTWTVIDWDNIESDPAREWDQFDEEDRAYVKVNFPDDYAKFFATFEPK